MPKDYGIDITIHRSVVNKFRVNEYIKLGSEKMSYTKTEWIDNVTIVDLCKT